MTDQYYVVEFPDDIADVLHKQLQDNGRNDIGSISGINLINVQENGATTYKLEFTDDAKIVFDYNEIDPEKKIPVQKHSSYRICKEVDKTEHIMLNVVQNSNEKPQYKVHTASNVYRRAYKDTSNQ